MLVSFQYFFLDPPHWDIQQHSNRENPTGRFGNGEEFIYFADAKARTAPDRAARQVIGRRVAERNEVQVSFAVLCELDREFQIAVCGIAARNERISLRPNFLKIRQICTVEVSGQRVAIEF